MEVFADLQCILHIVPSRQFVNQHSGGYIKGQSVALLAQSTRRQANPPEFMANLFRAIANNLALFFQGAIHRRPIES